MNFRELGIRATDKVFGQKVNGTVAAVLLDEVTSDELTFTRYVVKTEGRGYLDVRLLKNAGSNFLLTPAVPIETPQLSRGDRISIRASNVRPWSDGSR